MMKLTDFDTEDSPKLSMDFINNMKHTSDFDDMSVPYFDRLAVLVMEGVATDDERAEYAKLLRDNDENIKSAAIYSKCKLIPDDDIEYPAPQKLKRAGRVVPMVWKISAVAAAMALGFLALHEFSGDASVSIINGMAVSEHAKPVSRVISVSHDADYEAGTAKVVVEHKPSSVLTKTSPLDVLDDEELEFPEPQELTALAADIEMSVPNSLPESCVMEPVVMENFESELDAESRMVEIAKHKYGNMHKAVAGRFGRIKEKSVNVSRNIHWPIELKRNEQGQVEELSITAFNRNITYSKRF